MNWFKRQLNKLFYSEIDENEEYDDDKIKEDLQQSHKNSITPSPKDEASTKRSSFRFPLIADYELDVTTTTQQEPEMKKQHRNEGIADYLYQPHYQPNKITEVYDVEVSGIRELLENRKQGRGKSSSGNSQLPTTIRRVERKPLEVLKTINSKTTTNSQTKIENNKPENNKPVITKKRFVPTDVPSPVHGFKKPSDINLLLEKKEIELNQSMVEQRISEEEVNTIAIENETNIAGQAPILSEVNQAENEVASAIESKLEVDQNTDFINQNSLDNMEDSEASHREVPEQISKLLLKIENDEEEQTVALEDTYSEDVKEFSITSQEVAPVENDQNEREYDQTDDVDDNQGYEIVEPIIETDVLVDSSQPGVENLEEKRETKRSTLPFNVLMLKSDKEKYAAKLAQKQQSQHNHDTKEIPRPTLIEQNPIDAVDPISTNDLDDELNQEVVHNVLGENNEELEVNQPEDIAQEEVQKPVKVYVKPSFEFLSPPEEKTEDRDWMESQADILVEALSHFQVTAQVESIMQGPAVTQFEITVGHGTKVSKIRNLADDLKLALAAKDIRIQAPIPGKSSIGIEIPNRISRAVRLSEVTDSDSFIQSESPLEAALGLDLTGKPVTIDLRKMPHGLIAGATGSGKSVCINSILVSLLYKADPHELKLMLIDPKMVELAPFNHIPHLVSPVITDVKAATAALKWAVEEMERRYQLFAHAGVRDLPRFNKLAESNGEFGHKLPYILIVIDELADLMMMSPADVEEAICRIAQKARACGIHLIVATQRPSVDVITGLIKSNIPTRIAFAVSSQVDSRTILDSQGAERLLGRGDMLYLGNGMSAPIRLQGTFVTDDEIEEIIEHVRSQGEPDYIFEQDELLKKTEMVEEQDELFEEVCRFVYEQGTASTSSLQRKYHIGYNRAARLIDMLESQGFVSEQRGSKPREVYITDSDLSSMFN